MTSMEEQQRARLIAALTHLREPFDRKQISKLPATGKRSALDYVNHAVVTERLNRYAEDWTYDVTPVEVRGRLVRDESGSHFVCDPDGLPHVVAVFGTMTICGVTRQEVGEVDSFTTYGLELKNAISDFIRRGGMRFGVALALWSKEELEGVGPAPDGTAPAGTSDGDVVPREMTGEGAEPGPSPSDAPSSEEVEKEQAAVAHPSAAPPPPEDPSMDEVAPEDQWDVAVRHGLTSAKALLVAKRLFADAPKQASALTRRQLAAVIEETLK